ARGSRVRDPQALVDRPAPPGALSHAVGAEHPAQVQDADRGARREIQRAVLERRAGLAARRAQEIPEPRMTVRVERDGELALIIAHSPPVNTITAEVRSGLGAALAAVRDDAT